MSWYVVFQVESNDDFLPPDPEPGLRFGQWLKFVRGGRRAWALARRWAVDGRWAECMRVNVHNNPDVRAIWIADAVKEGPLGERVRIHALRIAQRAWI